jgi:predicted RNase H-like nuclease (RuvC/YqgF family)
MKVYKDDRGEHDLERRIEKLQLQIRDLHDTIQMYQQILRDAQKQIYYWKKFSYEDEKNKNLLQGYKKVIQDLSAKLRQKDS